MERIKKLVKVVVAFLIGLVWVAFDTLSKIIGYFRNRKRKD